MPSLARVMPVISLFIALFPSLIVLVARRAFLGVTVAVILKYLLDNLGLEFPVRAFGDLGQVEILDRIAVGIELHLGEFNLEIQRTQRHVGLFDDLSLVIEPKSGNGILAGLIIWN